MDRRRFDAWTRSIGKGATRRQALRVFSGGVLGAMTLGPRRVRAGQEKMPLCHATGDPENPYTVIEVAEPAWDTHLGHGDTPYVNCCVTTDCAAGQACVNGTCTAQCPGSSVYCALDNRCYYVSCGERAAWSEGTCRCECNDGYVRLPGGFCATPCTTNDDCGVWRCEAVLGGGSVCASYGDFVYCPTCDDHTDCYLACSSWNAYCRADGTCGAAVAV